MQSIQAPYKRPKKADHYSRNEKSRRPFEKWPIVSDSARAEGRNRHKAELRLFDAFRMEMVDGKPISIPLRKAQAILAYLSMNKQGQCSRDQIAALLWGNSSQSRARQSLRQTIMTITRELRDVAIPVLESRGQGLCVNGEAVWIDVLEFENLAVQNSSSALQRAVDLFSCGLLPGFTVDESPFDSWLDSERGRLCDLAISALQKLRDNHLKAGATDDAICTAKRILEIDPIREDVHRWLMNSYYQRGQRSLALAQYRQCREILQRELDAETEMETTHLAQQVLNQNWTIECWNSELGPVSTTKNVDPVDLQSGSRTDKEPRVDRQSLRDEEGERSSSTDETLEISEKADRTLRDLAPDARKYLEIVALGNQSIDAEVVKSVLNIKPDRAEEILSDLEKPGYIVEDGSTIKFVHDSMRKTVASNIESREARRIHLEILKILEGEEAPNLEALAHHFMMVGKVNRAMQAVEALAKKKISLGCLSEAEAVLRKTLSDISLSNCVVIDHKKLLELHIALIETELRQKNDRQLVVDMNSAAPIALQFGNRLQKGRLFYLQSRYYQRRKDYRRATDTCRRSFLGLVHSDYQRLLMKNECIIPQLPLGQDNQQSAINALKVRYENARRGQDIYQELDSGLELALLYGLYGQMDLAYEYSKNAKQLAQTMPDEIVLGVSEQVHGIVLGWRREFGFADKALENAKEIFAAEGDLPRSYIIKGYSSVISLQKGDPVSAVRQLRSAIADAQDIGTNFMLPMLKAWLAEAYFEKGSLARALQTARNACKLASESNNAWARSISARAIAKTLSAKTDSPTSIAQKAIRSAIEIQSALGLTSEHKASLEVQKAIQSRMS